MLLKGHHNVNLDAEGWDRLLTWIDLNVPCHGAWHEVKNIPQNFAQRRRDCAKIYAGDDYDPEAIPPTPEKRPAFIASPAETPRPQPMTISGFPFVAQLGEETKLDLGKGLTMVFRKIPAGSYVMGDVNGAPNEFPQQKVDIAKPFWMATTEVSLEQYQQFNPKHRNGYYDRHYKDQVNPGYPMDNPKFPVIRVSCDDAMAFCRWLSGKTGKKVAIPTEQQWEWAARAGTATPFYWGDLNTDFGKFANLADRQIKKLAVKGVNPQPIANPDKYWDFELKDARFDDGVLHLAEVGHYQPNGFGLYDMIGNVAQWTSSDYIQRPGRKVVRGGSWSDRPKDATASTRWGYPNWHRPFNVGFRVILESDASAGAATQAKGPQVSNPIHQFTPDH
jgi:formylglycine-generating enzyme required for sulfatase activity